MLVIRREQLEIFEEWALREYEDRLCTRLLEQYPEETGMLSEERLRMLVQDGVSHSARYGLESERDVALFVDLMLFLGPRFDEDPRLPWASNILNDEFIIDPGLRIDTLHAQALQFLSAGDHGGAEGTHHERQDEGQGRQTGRR